MQGFPLLTLLTFIPIVGMIIVLLLPKNSDNNVRYTTLAVTAIQLVLAIVMMLNFDYSAGGIFEMNSFQFIEKVNWIHIDNVAFLGTVKIDYFLGVDGLSAPLVLLSTLIFFVATFSAWTIKKSPKGFFAMYLLLNAATMGVFLSLDFFLFFVFWEVMLLPMYFLIGIWGGPRKEYAAIKFFIYTMLGGIFMLITMIGLYFSATELLADGTRVYTFNLLALMDQSNYLADGILSATNPDNWRFMAFIGLFVAFAVKIPMFPFHTWLPDAHVEAPTPISVVLAGVLLKLGTYGILRISFPIFPDITRELMWYIGLFGVINIVYGGLAAMAQKDFKKLIAYSSISHMGYVLLGMASL
jgi:NADH-quinone oxidoreductase subunit M